MKQNHKKTSLVFLGAAQTVTGSKFLLRANGKNILVDCGLFQGEKQLRLLNREPFPVDPASIDLVLLTHGHLDHCGYLPRLVDLGYTGEIWCTAPTGDISRLVLFDSARIQEEDAQKANDEKYSRHHPALPLYTEKEVKRTLLLFRRQPLDEWIEMGAGLACRFRYNGHILGAGFIEIKSGDKTIVFSGDIGRTEDPLLYAPGRPQRADVVVMESTYGNRLHSNDTEAQLIRIVHEVLEKKGILVIPSFAVERSQLLVLLLARLKKQDKIPPIPVYLDSPMGANAMEVFMRYTGWHKLSASECRMLLQETIVVQSLEETQRIAGLNEPRIVVAGSGMVTGGRVLHYLATYVGQPSATILLAGYQAAGTRGRALLDGAEEIKMFGKNFPVKATIESLDGISAHADQQELLHWIGGLEKAPQKIFIVHGEPDSAQALRQKISADLGYACEIPELYSEYDLF